MSISGNMQLHEGCKIVTGLAPCTPSSSTPDYVSLKGYGRMAIIIIADNGNTVTGSAITIKQATAVAGTSEKAVSFTKMWACTDTAAGDTLTETAVTSDTFTTSTTNAKNLLYIMEIDVQADLDIENSFDCVRCGTGNAANTVLAVLYVLYPARYAATAGPVPSAITD